MKKLRVFLVLALLYMLSSVSSAAARPQTTIRYVAPGGACASFQPCYATVQAASDAADSGDVIEIAAGTYTGVTSPNGVAEVAFISKSLTLRGGYDANFIASDPQANATILDAQAQGRVLYIDGTAASGAITVTLDGLQLTGGGWSTSEYIGNWAAAAGGGVRVENANLVLLNSRVFANHTLNGLGSGLFQHLGTFTMQNSRVENNSGTGGVFGPLSGMMGGGLFLLQLSANISASFILNNSAGYGQSNMSEPADGGGIFLFGSTATIDHTTFEGNQASQNDGGLGGGLYATTSSLTITNSSFVNNSAAPLHQMSYSYGGGAYLYYNTTSVLTGNLFQGNLDNGLVGLGKLTIKSNTFQGNSSGSYPPYLNLEGAIYLSGQGVFQNNTSINNTAVRGGGGWFGGSLAVTGNTFQGNTASGDGGGVIANDTVTLTRNLVRDNTSGGCGGGVLANGLALEDGDMLLHNTAWYGGGLCVRGNSGGGSYQNLVILNNVGSVNGSGVYVDRGTATGAVNLRHLTIGQNTGGDSSGVNVKTGAVSFTNTILYGQAVGVQNVGGSPTFSHTLRYQVTTPTIGTISDTFAITGDPAFTADGYHLAQNSAAIDGGVATPVTDDVDGGARPLGQAPDFGAVESPYTLSLPAGVQATQQAGTPHWILQVDPLTNATSFLLQQDYLIQYSYGGAPTSPALSSVSIQENFPSALQLSSQDASPAMAFSQNSNQLAWNATAPLAPGRSGWVGILGQSKNASAGLNLNSTGNLNYSINGGQTTTLPLQASSQVPAKPLMPPMLTSPLNGEMCLDEQGHLEASGLTYTGLLVHLYENSILVASTTADASGGFSLTWTTALTSTNSVNLYATVCDPAQPNNCSAPSTSTHLDYPEAYWCPQRSYWEGDVHNFHYVFHFVNEQGRFATNDFELPGVYGFTGTQLHLYSCCDRDTNPFTVVADGITYTQATSHQGRMWTFTIGSAHDVIIKSQCSAGGKQGLGRVLIDPDGFVFNSKMGGQYDSQTGLFTPVQSIAGITVTAYVYEPDWNEWVIWPAKLYNNQVNPQVTGADGYFAFFTPPGSYYLQATAANGYQAWRSPVIQVVAQAVHQNIPLTPWNTNRVSQVTITPYGPNSASVIVPTGGTVEWFSSLEGMPTLADVAEMTRNPILRILSNLNPLTNILGFDGGRLAPGQVYRRQFDQPGTYTYTDGAGHTAQVVVVSNQSFLPIAVKK